jgi:transposase
VSEACRLFGIHRSTYYRWKRQVELYGLEILRPRERRAPRMPQQLSPFVEQRILAFALGHPGYGPARIASELRQQRWGGIVVSHNGVWRCLRRHGLNTRAKRLSLVAGYAAPYQPPRQPEPERHVEAERPGELVGIDCFCVGRLSGTKGAVSAAERDRRRLLLRLGGARQLPARQPQRRPDLQACAPRRLRAPGGRLAP